MLCKLLVTLPLVAAFFDRSNGGLHLSSLPELRSGKHRRLAALGTPGQGHRLLTRNAQGELPEVHDSHRFVGVTDVGFIDFDTASITPPSTVLSDDYLDLLLGAAFACAPVPVPHAAESAAPVHRLTVTFPGGTPADEEGFAHLVSRIGSATAFVYGVETLLRHPALEAAGDCVAHAGAANPFFSIVDAAADAGGFVLTLTPTLPARVFNYMAASLVFNPNVTAEVARRRAEGREVGLERHLGVSYTKPLASFAVNWDASSQAAATPKLGIVDTTSLYCNNCYFYLNAALTVNVLVCAIRGPSTAPKFYDNNNGAGVADRASTDCKTTSGGLNTPVPSLTFDLGMSVEAYFQGDAGFSFEIKSDGIAAANGWPSSCTSGDSSSCVRQNFPIPAKALETILVSVAGVPVTVDTSITLKGAGWVNAAMSTFRLSFGASAKVSAKLGGKVSFSTLGSTFIPTLTPTVYKDFSAQYSQLPFSLSGFTAAAVATDATIFPIVTLTVWKVVPFEVTPQIQLKYSLAAQTARRLGTGAAGARELETCASGSSTSSATVVGALGVKILQVRTFGVVQAATTLDLSAIGPAVSAFDVVLIPETPLASPADTTFSVSGALATTAMGTCAKVGTSIFVAGAVAPPAGEAQTTIIAAAAGGGGGALLLLLVAVWLLRRRKQAPAPISSGEPATSAPGGAKEPLGAKALATATTNNPLQADLQAAAPPAPARAAATPAAAAGSDADLPPGWFKKGPTPEGLFYYDHPATTHTQWDPPTLEGRPEAAARAVAQEVWKNGAVRVATRKGELSSTPPPSAPPRWEETSPDPTPPPHPAPTLIVWWQGELPPEWDFSQTAAGKIYFITPSNKSTFEDPRVDFEAYAREFVAAERRGVNLREYFGGT